MDTPQFDHCNSLPVTPISVTFQYELKQLIYHYFNTLSSNTFEI